MFWCPSPIVWRGVARGRFVVVDDSRCKHVVARMWLRGCRGLVSCGPAVLLSPFLGSCASSCLGCCVLSVRPAGVRDCGRPGRCVIQASGSRRPGRVRVINERVCVSLRYSLSVHGSYVVCFRSSQPGAGGRETRGASGRNGSKSGKRMCDG